MEQDGSRRFDLLAVDLDGTLLSSSPEIAPRVVESLRAAAALGVRVTIATGRMFLATLPYAKRLGVNTPLICYQGAQIRDPTTREVLAETLVDAETAREVILYCGENGYHVNAFIGDELFMSAFTPEGRFYSELAGVEPNIVGDLSVWLEKDVLKLVIVTDEKTTVKIVQELGPRFEGRLYVTRSYPIFAETISHDVSKGRALAALARRLGIPLQRVMAIGDNLNDMDLVTTAGFGVAMGNGSPEVKERADYVTGNVEEDGVATAVERFILNQSG